MMPDQATSTAFEDGLGQRWCGTSSSGEPLEVLALRPEIAAATTFEFLLRERVSRLASFRHASFARVRDVERVTQGESSLAVVSDRVAGARLSDLLTVAEQQLQPFPVDAAFALARQIVPALAAMHEEARDACHGAVAPERIVVTPDGRVVVVEHVLGAVLAQLGFSPSQYWKELRIALPTTAGEPRFDRRSDVTQLGVTVLALFLGRPITDDEYPTQMSALVHGTYGLGGGFEPFPEWLQVWLGRTLQLDPRRSFANAIEARDAFASCLEHVDERAGQAALMKFLKDLGLTASDFHGALLESLLQPEPSTTSTATEATEVEANSPVPEVVMPTPIAVDESPRPSAPAATSVPVAPVLPVEIPAAAPPVVPPAARAVVKNTVTPVEFEAALAPDPEPEYAPTPVGASNSGRYRLIAAAVVLMAIMSGGVFAARRYLATPPATSTEGTLAVTTNPAGVAVLVDDKPRGVTPVTLRLAAGDHVLVLDGSGVRRTIPVTITANNQLSQFIELPKTAPIVGQLQVRSEPGGAKVSVDGQPRGVTPVTVEGLSPGSHKVVVENELGSVSDTVSVDAGATASLMVPLKSPGGSPVSGWMAVNAPAELQVFEGGNLLGTSRSDRIMVTAGRHQLELVNEALGYRVTQDVQVAPGQVAQLKPTWPKGSIAINALPWAEVWLDGNRLGETPIGNTSVPIGTHEVVFKHPDLGEQRHTATVTAGAAARLSIDLRKK
jgi:serine/threonine protein kinase